MLSPLLSGDASALNLELNPPEWWDAGWYSPHYRAGRRVGRSRRAQSPPRRRAANFLFEACLRDGFARASPAVKGSDLPGVTVFRTLSDTRELVSLAERGAKVAVVGGGLLGIEAAYGLSKRGARVTLVHLKDRLMDRQLDTGAAGMGERRWRDKASKCSLKHKANTSLGRTGSKVFALPVGVD